MDAYRQFNGKTDVSNRRNGNIEPFEEMIERAALEIGIDLSKGEIALFSQYYREILLWNKQISLVSIKSLTDIPIKHIIDSLTVAQFINKDDARLLDIGTGAGFPGIPLKIIKSSLKVTLVDSYRKKVSFLKNVVRKLNLTDTVIINARIEHLKENKKESGSYDVVVSRATFKLSQYLAEGVPFLSTDGMLIAMKGKSVTQELEDAEDVLRKTCLKLVECHEIRLPVIGDKRFILVFKRV